MKIQLFGISEQLPLMENYNVTYYALPIIELYLSNFRGALHLTACRLRTFVMLFAYNLEFYLNQLQFFLGLLLSQAHSAY